MDTYPSLGAANASVMTSGMVQKAALQAQHAAKETLTDEVLNRLAGMIQTADDTIARLAVTRDRTFGCCSDEECAGVTIPPPNGKANEIQQALDGLSQRLYRANALAAELQSRL